MFGLSAPGLCICSLFSSVFCTEETGAALQRAQLSKFVAVADGRIANAYLWKELALLNTNSVIKHRFVGNAVLVLWDTSSTTGMIRILLAISIKVIVRQYRNEIENELN